MKNFKDGFSDFKKKGNDFGGRPTFGRGRDRQSEGSFRRGPKAGGRPSGQELFTATCSTCKKSCEVPFRPSGDKPVYCSACFGKTRDDNTREERGGTKRDGYQNNSRGASASYQKSARPYQSSPAAGVGAEKELAAIKQQLAKIELQLNRVLGFVNPPVPKVVKEEAAVPVDIVEAEAAPKKERKPKIVKPKAAPVKKAVKKVVKKAVKKK